MRPCRTGRGGVRSEVEKVRLLLRGFVTLGSLAFLGSVAGWSGTPPPATATGAAYVWHLPKGFPEPQVPAVNPMTQAKVELGRYLFYDKRMSSNGHEACATCHQQELAFTDGRTVGIGTTGESHSRNAMSLVNVAYNSALTWSDPRATRLEDQARVPMFGTHPIELGMGDGGSFMKVVRSDPTYRKLFASAFGPGGYTIGEVAKAIACFERSIISARSPYDRYYYGGDDNSVSAAAKHGEELFFSEPSKCFHCHGGFNFSDSTASALSHSRRAEFHNTGLYDLASPISYPEPNVGIYDHTKNLADVGKYKVPTLRNVAVTGRYMHDGSIATLEGVLDHYAAGGRTITSGPYTGIGSKNPNKDPMIAGFKMSATDRGDLIAFLDSLTDAAVLHDPRFANPWPR